VVFIFQKQIIIILFQIPIYNGKAYGILLDGNSSRNTINANCIQNSTNGVTLNNSASNKIINNQIIQIYLTGIKITGVNSQSNYIYANNICKNGIFSSCGINILDGKRNCIYSNSSGFIMEE